MPEGVVGNGGADEECTAKHAFAAAGGDLLYKGVKAVVEANGVDDTRIVCGGREVSGFDDIDAQGLLADHVNALLHSLKDEFVVQGVGCADVDGVEASVERRGKADVGVRHPQNRGCCLSSFRR